MRNQLLAVFAVVAMSNPTASFSQAVLIAENVYIPSLGYYAADYDSTSGQWRVLYERSGPAETYARSGNSMGSLGSEFILTNTGGINHHLREGYSAFAASGDWYLMHFSGTTLPENYLARDPNVGDIFCQNAHILDMVSAAAPSTSSPLFCYPILNFLNGTQTIHLSSISMVGDEGCNPSLHSVENYIQLPIELDFEDEYLTHSQLSQSTLGTWVTYDVTTSSGRSLYYLRRLTAWDSGNWTGSPVQVTSTLRGAYLGEVRSHAIDSTAFGTRIVYITDDSGTREISVSSGSTGLTDYGWTGTLYSGSIGQDVQNPDILMTGEGNDSVFVAFQYSESPHDSIRVYRNGTQIMNFAGQHPTLERGDDGTAWVFYKAGNHLYARQLSTLGTFSDECGEANELECSSTVTGNITEFATVSIEAMSCQNDPDVWYYVDVSTPGTQLTASFQHGSSQGAVALYTGTCGALSEYDCDSTSGPEAEATIITTIPNQRVWIRVAAEYNGEQELSVSCVTPTPTPTPTPSPTPTPTLTPSPTPTPTPIPLGDRCSNPILIEIEDWDEDSYVLVGNITGLANDAWENSTCIISNPGYVWQDQWFRLSVPAFESVVYVSFTHNDPDEVAVAIYYKACNNEVRCVSKESPGTINTSYTVPQNNEPPEHITDEDYHVYVRVATIGGPSQDQTLSISVSQP